MIVRTGPEQPSRDVHHVVGESPHLVQRNDLRERPHPARLVWPVALQREADAKVDPRVPRRQRRHPQLMPRGLVVCIVADGNMRPGRCCPECPQAGEGAPGRQQRRVVRYCPVGLHGQELRVQKLVPVHQLVKLGEDFRRQPRLVPAEAKPAAKPNAQDDHQRHGQETHPASGEDRAALHRGHRRLDEVRHLTGGGKTPAGFFFQAAEDGGIPALGQIRHSRLGGRRPFIHALEGRLQRRGAGEGRLPSQHLVQHQPQCINVRRRAHRSARHLLGRHGLRGAEQTGAGDVFSEVGVGVERTGNPEVGQRHAQAGRASAGGRGWHQHDVAGLEVPVDDARGVGRIQSGGHLPQQRQHLRWRHSAFALQPLEQRLAVQEFHGEEVQRLAGGRLRRVQVINAADVGVAGLSGQEHLAAKALQGRAVVREMRKDGLQRNVGMQHLVLCLVHLAHAARGDEAENGEAARERLALLQARCASSAGRGRVRGTRGEFRGLRGLPRHPPGGAGRGDGKLLRLLRSWFRRVLAHVAPRVNRRSILIVGRMVQPSTFTSGPEVVSARRPALRVSRSRQAPSRTDHLWKCWDAPWGRPRRWAKRSPRPRRAIHRGQPPELRAEGSNCPPRRVSARVKAGPP